MKIERGGLPDGIHIETLGNTNREAAEAIAPIAKDLRSRVLSIATAFRGINGCEWLRSLAAVWMRAEPQRAGGTGRIEPDAGVDENSPMTSNV